MLSHILKAAHFLRQEMPPKFTPRKTTYEDYDIDVNVPDHCPRCDRLFCFELNLKDESWYCTQCHWRGKLKSINNPSIMDASQAAPNLERWHVTGPPQGMSWGWDNADSYVHSLRGEWTLIVGYPGHGKTHIINAVMVNMAAKGWKFGVFSPENLPYERHVKQLAQKFLGKRFDECTADEVKLAQWWLAQHFFFIDPVEPTFEAILAQVRKLVKEKRIEAFIIDPWNEVEHEVPHGMNEHQYTARALIKLRRFCEAMHVHAFIVAHPSKIQMQRKAGDEKATRPVVRLADASGSSHFENKCFFGVSLWRNPMAEGEDKHLNDVYVLKARNEDLGKVGNFQLRWDPRSTSFRDAQYQYNQDPHADAVKEFIEKKVSQGTLKWSDPKSMKFLMRMIGKEVDELRARPIQWKVVSQDNYQGDVGILYAKVYFVKGPAAGDSFWAAEIYNKEQVPVVVKDFGNDEKEQALDWCEKQMLDRDLKGDGK